MLREKVREWCIERAIELLVSDKSGISFTSEDVIDVAKALEDYIWNKEK